MWSNHTTPTYDSKESDPVASLAVSGHCDAGEVEPPYLGPENSSEFIGKNGKMLVFTDFTHLARNDFY